MNFLKEVDLVFHTALAQGDIADFGQSCKFSLLLLPEPCTKTKGNAEIQGSVSKTPREEARG